jgi:hypothetical protein
MELGKEQTQVAAAQGLEQEAKPKSSMTVTEADPYYCCLASLGTSLSHHYHPFLVDVQEIDYFAQHTPQPAP